jgi:tetratricopeptide (TPR) repeat protein
VEPSMRRVVRGDLDAVIGKALRKDAADRYATIGELAADLAAWRAGRPVAATPASVGYRVSRFVARHKTAVAAGIVVVLALAGGATTAAWQARIARQERDKAQNRFKQVQEFSRSLLFDVHDALRQLPGATEPRRLLLDRAVRFLDGLTADAADDDALKLELAEGFRRLGHVQGAVNSENLGDTAAALRSFERATTLAESALAARPGDLESVIATVNAATDFAVTLQERGDTEQALRVSARQLELVETLARRRDSVLATARAARGFSDAGGLAAERSDLETARRHYSRSVALFESLPAGDRATEQRMGEYATVLKRLGAVLMVNGDLAGSERHYTKALALDQEALARSPRDERNQFAMTFTLSDLALVQFREGKVDAAEATWTKALDMRQAALSADPKNVRAMAGVATIFGRLGTVASARGQFAVAARHYTDELRIREQLVTLQGPLPGRVSERAWATLRIAEMRVKQADATPPDPARAGWLAAARRLMLTIEPSDGRVPVPAGSEPGFLELHRHLTDRLAR